MSVDGYPKEQKLPMEATYRQFPELRPYKHLSGNGCIQNPSTSNRMHLDFEGLSHGLKSVHRTLFAPVFGLVPPFRVPSEH